MLVKAGGIGGHRAEHIVGVGVCHRAVEAGSIQVGGGVVVHTAADVAETVSGGVESHRSGFVAECAACHTQEVVECEAATHEVVHLHTVYIHALVLVVESAESEIHRAEIIGGRVVENVVVGTGERRHALGCTFFVFHNGFVEQKVLSVAEEFLSVVERNEADFPEVYSSCRDVDVGTIRLVAVGRNGDIVGSSVGTKPELAVEVSGGAHMRVAQAHHGARQRAAVAAVDHHTHHRGGGASERWPCQSKEKVQEQS